jgi:glycolate oxidase
MWRFGLARKLRKIVSKDAVLEGGAILQRYPSLTDKSRPQLVCLPQSAEQISQTLEAARASKIPIALLGGTNSAAASFLKDSILIDLARMNKILEIDSANLCAVVQPLASLSALSGELEALGLAACTSNINAATAIDAASAATGIQLVLPTGRRANIGGKPQDALGYSLAPLFAGTDIAFGIPTRIFLRLERKNQMRAKSPGTAKSDPSPAEAELLGRLSDILNPSSTGKLT